MPANVDNTAFLEEFEALKKKYGAAFADLQAVRFSGDDGYGALPREFVPYSCRTDANGFIQCEKQRPM